MKYIIKILIYMLIMSIFVYFGFVPADCIYSFCEDTSVTNTDVESNTDLEQPNTNTNVKSFVSKFWFIKPVAIGLLCAIPPVIIYTTVIFIKSDLPLYDILSMPNIHLSVQNLQTQCEAILPIISKNSYAFHKDFYSNIAKLKEIDERIAISLEVVQFWTPKPNTSQFTTNWSYIWTYIGTYFLPK